MRKSCNTDGSVNIAHNSSNPGRPENLPYPSVKAFEEDWGQYGTIQYYPLNDAETNLAPEVPAGAAAPKKETK